MDWKHDLYRKVAPFVRDDAIFASNTSGLPIAKLSEAMEPGLKARFCGVHFFNPPRYMHLVELIPTPATQPADPRRSRDLPDLDARQGRGARQGHAELRGEPRRHLRHAGDDQGSREVRTVVRRRRRPDRLEARPRQERDLPHGGRGRPGHDGACHQDDAGHAAGVDRPVRGELRHAAGAQGPGRKGRVRARRRVRASIGRKARPSRSSIPARASTWTAAARPTNWSRAS